MKWADFLHADTDLGKLAFTLIIIEWTFQKWVRPYIMGLLNQVYLPIDLINWEEYWLNDFCMQIGME